jgi:asparagine synthase (glutamine-hydrolysing)
MAYPLYLAQLPELQDSNIIDGGGNDIYMQTPLVKSDFNKYYLSRVFSPLRPIVEKFISSESRLNPLTKTYIEWWSGFGGLTFGDSKRIFKNATNSRKYLQNEIEKRKTIDKTTLKTDFLTTIMAAEQHIRKFRTASDVYRSNAILPFSSEKLAKYFHSMPTEQLFNRKTGKNKLILREILKQEIDLDSDALGKYGYEFDFWKVIESLGGDVKKEVVECSLWDHDEITILCNKFYSVIHSDSPNSKRAQAWIHRLYLISSWYNKNKYIKK